MKQEPLILAIETSLSPGSLSILKGEKLIDSYVGTERTTLRSENLLKELENLLKRNDFQLEDLDLIAVSTGPGSFTGIRVGMAAAQALALALNCRIIGVSILQALAYGSHAKDEIISVVPASRNQLFWQKFTPESILENNVSCVYNGDIQKFVKECSLSGDDNSTIITIDDLNELFQSQELREWKIIKPASDNASKIIGLFSLNFAKKYQQFEKEIHPEYILEVEIGRSN